ncbi:MAG: hypothetical protein ABEJ04_01820 [Halobacteriaceae archaeon]
MTRYACVRVVRESAGAPDAPELDLPDGYAVHARGLCEQRTPAEYAVFVAGPDGDPTAAVRWPGSEIRAVVCGDERLPLDRTGDGVRCVVPVRAASTRECWSTLNVHSHVGDGDLPVRVEHNDPDRRAGHYADVPWVGPHASACLNFLFAAREALSDAGLPGSTPGPGHLELMGFESNHALHGDFPPHWHLSYLLSDLGVGSHVPHFYLNERGHVTRNFVVRLGYPERTRTAGVRDPTPYETPGGETFLATDVRRDGGLDLGPAPGEWTHSLRPARDGDCTGAVRVFRDGDPLCRVACEDDTVAGELSVAVTPLDGGHRRRERHRYDPLTGTLRA